jgi:hypothetical protein
MSKKALRIIEFSAIAALAAVVVAYLSITAYRAVISSDWYNEMLTEKSFKNVFESVNDTVGIKYVKVDDNIEERFIEDVPAALFDDMRAISYERTSDIEKLRDIWSQGCVTVFFYDGTYESFFITDDGEIYWGADLEVECPSLLKWYADVVEAAYNSSPDDD